MKYIVGDAIEELKKLPSESVNAIITSPPYYALRDYGATGQIGQEKTPDEFIHKLTEVFSEARRVLRSDGVLWLNLGDSYGGRGKGFSKGKRIAVDERCKQSTSKGTIGGSLFKTGGKPKELLGIPWCVALALSADGWYLRQDIIWHKPNPMPESVKDRCTKAHEYIFLLSKSPKYYFDAEAIAEPVQQSSMKRYAQNIEKQLGSSRVPGKNNGNMKAVMPRYGVKKYTENPSVFFRTKSNQLYIPGPMRNKRDVWTVATKGFKGAHFATFPEELIEPCVLSSVPEGGVALDPFAGSGTVGAVCKRLGRDCIMIDINAEYERIARERIGLL
ncbi:MAG: site-specific DNA-methyltransferase [Clostridia bacterium]|nr:site-specific DNA-methyltransferase [Clostridia bacterium]